MARLIPSDFCSYDLSAEETLRASQFNVEQKMYLQTLLSQYAKDVLAMRFDPAKELEFVQENAEKQGVIIFIQYLLATSEESAQITQQNPQTN